MNLYFVTYNNRYNMTYRYEEELIDYLGGAAQPNLAGTVIGSFLWNDNDGVSTEVILNYEPRIPYKDPDYCLVTDENNIIESRWFVAEMTRTRKGQYLVKLYRDVVADSRDILPELTVLARRGLLPQDNTLLFQAEDIKVNQIKTEEIELKDETQTAWIVGYMAKNLDDSTTITNIGSGYSVYRTVSNFEELPYSEYTYYPNHQSPSFYKGPLMTSTLEMELIWTKTSELSKKRKTFYTKFNSITETEPSETAFEIGFTTINNFPTAEQIRTAYPSRVDSTWVTEISNYFGANASVSELISLNGKIVYNSTTGKFYKYGLRTSPAYYNEQFDAATTNSTFPGIRNIALGLGANGIKGGQGAFSLKASLIKYALVLEEISVDGTFTFTIPANRTRTKDAPYDIFCIPYGSFNNNGSKENAMNIASAIIRSFITGSQGSIYDVQILPYCPLPQTNFLNLTAGMDYLTVKDQSTQNTLGTIYFCPVSIFTKSFSLQAAIEPTDKKIDYLTKLYRFCSPNFSSQFEISASMNEGFDIINVSATYMPFNPYIKVAPQFHGLYGSNFGDMRGLILSGDYSLPMVNDAWTQYQQNNKNFQSIFDRQIHSMELSNSINKQIDIFQTTAGALSGMATGAAAGGVVGGLPIAAIGGAVGAVSAGAAGIADFHFNTQLRQEAVNLKKDLHSLSLQNIQAMPASLVKTTAFTPDNKIFPILEIYSCSETEYEAVKNLLLEKSFSIGAIMKMSDLLEISYEIDGETAHNWIAATPIRFPQTLGKDEHFLNVLSSVLSQGYYFENWNRR